MDCKSRKIISDIDIANLAQDQPMIPEVIYRPNVEERHKHIYIYIYIRPPVNIHQYVFL